MFLGAMAQQPVMMMMTRTERTTGQAIAGVPAVCEQTFRVPAGDFFLVPTRARTPRGGGRTNRWRGRSTRG